MRINTCYTLVGWAIYQWEYSSVLKEDFLEELAKTNPLGAILYAKAKTINYTFASKHEDKEIVLDASKEYGLRVAITKRNKIIYSIDLPWSKVVTFIKAEKDRTFLRFRVSDIYIQ